jgi:lipopolysaccharide transport system permease protein
MPVAYSSDLVPAKWQFLYALNPMVGVVDGFRYAILGQVPSLTISPYISATVIMLLLVSGLIYFSRVEQSIADLI